MYNVRVYDIGAIYEAWYTQQQYRDKRNTNNLYFPPEIKDQCNILLLYRYSSLLYVEGRGSKVESLPMSNEQTQGVRVQYSVYV